MNTLINNQTIKVFKNSLFLLYLFINNLLKSSRMRCCRKDAYFCINRRWKYRFRLSHLVLFVTNILTTKDNWCTPTLLCTIRSVCNNVQTNPTRTTGYSLIDFIMPASHKFNKTPLYRAKPLALKLLNVGTTE